MLLQGLLPMVFSVYFYQTKPTSLEVTMPLTSIINEENAPMDLPTGQSDAGKASETDNFLPR